ncbi:hypothetical protein D3C86_1463700 [compost metagenome]
MQLPRHLCDATCLVANPEVRKIRDAGGIEHTPRLGKLLIGPLAVEVGTQLGSGVAIHVV